MACPPYFIEMCDCLGGLQLEAATNGTRTVAPPQKLIKGSCACQPGARPQERERYSAAYSEQVHPYSRHAAPPTYSAKAVKRFDFTNEDCLSWPKEIMSHKFPCSPQGGIYES